MLYHKYKYWHIQSSHFLQVIVFNWNELHFSSDKMKDLRLENLIQKNSGVFSPETKKITNDVFIHTC